MESGLAAIVRRSNGAPSVVLELTRDYSRAAVALRHVQELARRLLQQPQLDTAQRDALMKLVTEAADQEQSIAHSLAFLNELQQDA